MWIHRLSDVDPNAQTATCRACGPGTPVRFRKDRKRWMCLAQVRAKNYLPDGSLRPRTAGRICKPYRRHKQEACAACGFIPVDRCQLDVDHVDGNHDNDDPENLQTLCSNCHRLKTLRPALFAETYPRNTTGPLPK